MIFKQTSGMQGKYQIFQFIFHFDFEFLCVFFAVPAKIDHTSYSPSLRLKVGQDFKLDVKFTGQPMPTVTWSTEKKVQRCSFSN